MFTLKNITAYFSNEHNKQETACKVITIGNVQKYSSAVRNEHQIILWLRRFSTRGCAYLTDKSWKLHLLKIVEQYELVGSTGRLHDVISVRKTSMITVHAVITTCHICKSIPQSSECIEKSKFTRFFSVFHNFELSLSFKKGAHFFRQIIECLTIGRITGPWELAKFGNLVVYLNSSRTTSYITVQDWITVLATRKNIVQLWYYSGRSWIQLLSSSFKNMEHRMFDKIAIIRILKIIFT